MWGGLGYVGKSGVFGNVWGIWGCLGYVGKSGLFGNVCGMWGCLGYVGIMSGCLGMSIGEWMSTVYGDFFEDWECLLA